MHHAHSRMHHAHKRTTITRTAADPAKHAPMTRATASLRFWRRNAACTLLNAASTAGARAKATPTRRACACTGQHRSSADMEAFARRDRHVCKMHKMSLHDTLTTEARLHEVPNWRPEGLPTCLSHLTASPCQRQHARTVSQCWRQSQAYRYNICVCEHCSCVALIDARVHVIGIVSMCHK